MIVFHVGPRWLTSLIEVFKTWFPVAYSEAEKVSQQLKAHNPDLWPDGPEPIWPWHSGTSNLRSSRTFSCNHRDMKNGTVTVCAVQDGGPHNYRRGGQLVLHEYRLIIELQPGQVILFPSALITHCNIPIQKGEERYSLTLYSPGGLYRYVAYGCRTWKVFEAEDPASAADFERHHIQRWKGHWDGMPRIPDLKTLWTLQV